MIANTRAHLFKGESSCSGRLQPLSSFTGDPVSGTECGTPPSGTRTEHQRIRPIFPAARSQGKSNYTQYSRWCTCGSPQLQRSGRHISRQQTWTEIAKVTPKTTNRHG
ncbi:uncharacterized protein [Narcine bancroftii]|uniref:uncharacterized protein isoform X2 n=1 Tax=Narcine bancroftii TaxID=1343680 RepID=UPI0038319961